MRKRLIVANWKMHMQREEAGELAQGVVDLLQSRINNNVGVVLAPPYTSLDVVREIIRDTRIKLGAQNVFWEDEGAYTGEVSPLMLRDAGCKWVIIGHSERRQILGETDEMVREKVKSSLRAGLIPIVCVGETAEEREEGNTIKVIKNQMMKGFEEIKLDSADDIVIAYEPVWAIGTGVHATPEQAESVHKFIRETAVVIFGEIAGKIKILYGGSVAPENIKEMIAPPNVDGALVGGASLKAESFARIVQISGE